MSADAQGYEDGFTMVDFHVSESALEDINDAVGLEDGSTSMVYVVCGEKGGVVYVGVTKPSEGELVEMGGSGKVRCVPWIKDWLACV